MVLTNRARKLLRTLTKGVVARKRSEGANRGGSTDQYLQSRITEVEQAINKVSETLRYALIDEQSHVGGNTSLKRRLQWIQESTASQTGLLLSIQIAAWIIAVATVAATIHHW